MGVDNLRNKYLQPDEQLTGIEKLRKKYTGTASPSGYSADAIETPRDDKLKKDDLLQPQNIRVIKNYMAQRYGKDAVRDVSEADLVENFVDSMRWFNTNIASTAGEARYIMNGDDRKRQSAKEAYELYDRLGSVFVNDGVMGAVDGVKDYIFAAAADPSNYIGLLTGGIAKASAVGATTAGKAAIRELAKSAGEEALKKGLNTKARDAAVKKAQDELSKQIVKRGIREKSGKELLKKAAKKEKELYDFAIKRKAEEAFMQDLGKKATKRGLIATTATDATAAMLHDVMIQSTLMDVGAQEKYSATQTAFSSLLGGVAGGIHLAGTTLKGTSKLEGVAADIDIGKQRQKMKTELDLALSKKEASDAVDAVFKGVRSWEQKVKSGKELFEDQPTSVELIKDIMFGADGKGGLVKIYKDKNIKLPKDMKVTDLMTNLMRYMSDDQIKNINSKISSLGIRIGETTQITTTLEDLVADTVSRGAQSMNVMSQVRRTIDAGIVHGENIIKNQADDMLEDPATKAKYGEYMQSLWRRMLVSTPATSAINLLGFAQYYGGTAIADVLSMTGLYTTAMLKGGTATKAGRESMRFAGVYKDMTTQKLRYLADPFTTKDAYMKILDEYDDVRRILYDSLTGGVDINASRYGINRKSGIIKGLEATANGASIAAGVRAQDTITKSLMFMTELDKQVRLKHEMPLDDLLRNGRVDMLDEEIVGKAMDQTLKSVFSKDYTKGDGSEFLKGAADLVETISRKPGFGTIVPFGRFMNNVVASTYQWTVAGYLPYARSIMKQNTDLGHVEALSRSVVGTSFLGMAIMYDEERQKDNLGTFDIKVGNRIVDAQNTFPMSLFLASGRMLNDARKGRGVTGEQWMATLEQLAVGQLASDIQFKNDIRAIGEALFSQEGGQRDAVLNGLAMQTGNFLAGYTRPLDAANKVVGMVANNDAVRDKRQSTGFEAVGVTSTKYVDNLLEALLGEMDGVTGETLRVATREGDLRDPNPFLSALGVKIREGRTPAEELLDRLDEPRYMANSRTEIAAYDRAFNETIAPYLNQRAEALLSNEEYNKRSKQDKRRIWKMEFNDIKKDIRKYLENADTESHIEAIRRKASAVDKNVKKGALKLMREEGFDGTVREMTYPELRMFFDYVDYYKATTNWTK